MKFMIRTIVAAVLMMASMWASAEKVTMTFKLYGQTRKFSVEITEKGTDLVLSSRIERNGAIQESGFVMNSVSRAKGSRFSYPMPWPGKMSVLPEDATFAVLSKAQYDAAKKNGAFYADKAKYELKDSENGVLHFADKEEGSEMWVRDDSKIPLIVEMRNNPLGFNWKVAPEITKASTPYEEMAAEPRKAGGSYYSYPWASELREGLKSTGVTTDLPPVQSEAPAGFKPVYISHYGRHGSRWLTDEWKYQLLVNVFDSLHTIQKLTPLGEDVRERLHKVYEDAEGRVGNLTEVGVAQHRGIAKRMIANFPSLFAGNTFIEAKSSIKTRCIMSMMAFCESLKEVNPQLVIAKEAAERYTYYINNKDFEPAAKKQKKLWIDDFHAYTNENMPTDRLYGQLFTENPFSDRVAEIKFGDAMYWVAENMQDTTCEQDFFDLYTTDELYKMASIVNYRMYIDHSHCPQGAELGLNSANNLLKKIIEEAELSLAGKGPQVTLRFGHDTALLNFLFRIGIEGCHETMTEPKEFAVKWQLYKVAPMAANIQMIFYRNAEGETLVKFLLNEQEALMPSLKPYSGRYYRWEDVKRL